MEFIMGKNRNQINLLPDSIDDYVDENNAVRVVDAYINSLNLAELGFSQPQPNNTGRPMYDPKDLLKLYLYGYMNRIRSSRRLETETKRNLEVIWLMNKLTPDHKTIARFRHDNTAALKNVFRDFVKLCTNLGLYGRELVAIDGSKFKAVNAKERNFNDKKLAERIARIDAKIEEYLCQLEKSDSEENAAPGEKTSEEIAKIICELEERKTTYQGYKEELSESGERQKSLTDPDSRLMKANGKMDICYNVQTAVDSKNKLIAEFEVTNEAVDKNQLTPMAKGAAEILEAEELQVTADVGYDSAQDIVKCMEQGITPHIAGTDFDICLPTDIERESVIEAHKNGRCIYDAERNIVLCPMGKVLYPGFYKKANGVGVFYNYKACKECSCKCTSEKRGRRHEVSMKESDFSKSYNDKKLFARQIRIAPDRWVVKQRKSIVEHPFGTIKRSMDSGYCLTKGLGNVTGEFSLAFLAYNLKRAINILGCGKLIEGIQA
ncbi:MAG: IS1182 family transposase [Clostridiaceae bacterium]|nr:IS1182 family transposase [Clostridiaceae bacterium]